MKYKILISLILVFGFYNINAQGLDLRYKRQPDSTKIVSIFGHYISFGLGGGKVYHQDRPLSSLMGYSFAYKSHLFSLTYGWGSNFGGGDEGKDGFYNHYYGLLLGESVRLEHLLASASVGLAYSKVDYYFHPVPPPLYHETEPYYIKGLTFPLEFKVFFLFRNVVGIGVHMSMNMVSEIKYSPFLFSISLVFGKWNGGNDRIGRLDRKFNEKYK